MRRPDCAWTAAQTVPFGCLQSRGNSTPETPKDATRFPSGPYTQSAQVPPRSGYSKLTQVKGSTGWAAKGSAARVRISKQGVRITAERPLDEPTTGGGGLCGKDASLGQV
jgi:hypothetical protein